MAVLLVVAVSGVPASSAGVPPGVRWTSWFGTQGDAGAVAVAPDGSTVFATGSTEDADGSNVTTWAFATVDGRRRWQASFDGPGHGDDFGRSIAVTPDGQMVIVVAGIAGSTTKRCATSMPRCA